jgi:5'-nucleotidase
MITYVRKQGLTKGTALSVNIPAVPPEEIVGVAITRQGVARFEERYERRVDPRGNVYFWLTGEIPAKEEAPDSDIRRLKENQITITPIHYDLTSYEEMARLQFVDPPQCRFPSSS